MPKTKTRNVVGDIGPQRIETVSPKISFRERWRAASALRGEVIWQWYTSSIADRKKTGMGNFKGMTEVLPEMVAGFPVTSIWLTPPYESPWKDGGYDVKDYTRFDPKFGTVDEFLTFKDEAHAHGIKVIIDIVPNHLSDQHEWFQKSRQSRDSDNQYRDYFIWRDPSSDGQPPNGAISNVGGSAWEYDEQREQYYLHMFLKEQPDLNWDIPEVRKAMIRTMVRMIDEWKVDGFRVDVADFIGKFIDENGEIGIDERTGEVKNDTSKAIDYLTEMADEICGRGKFLLFEAYPDEKDRKLFYEVSPEGLAAPFNFDFIFKQDHWGNAIALRNDIEEYLEGLRPQDVPIWVLGNHDHSRIVSRIGAKQARLAALLQFALPGIPVVYYGEEIGMHDVDVPPEQSIDLFTAPDETGPAGKERSNFRTPYQRTSDQYAGFSMVKPYLPLPSPEDYKENNMETELNHSDSMLALYRRLIELKHSPALTQGDFSFAETIDENVLVMKRSCEGEEMTMVINFSSEKRTLQLAETDPAKVLLTTSMNGTKETANLAHFELEPEEGYMFARQFSKVASK